MEKEVTEKERQETEVLVIKSQSNKLGWETNEQKKVLYEKGKLREGDMEKKRVMKRKLRRRCKKLLSEIRRRKTTTTIKKKTENEELTKLKRSFNIPVSKV